MSAQATRFIAYAPKFPFPYGTAFYNINSNVPMMPICTDIFHQLTLKTLCGIETDLSEGKNCETDHFITTSITKYLATKMAIGLEWYGTSSYL